MCGKNYLIKSIIIFDSSIYGPKWQWDRKQHWKSVVVRMPTFVVIGSIVDCHCDNQWCRSFSWLLTHWSRVTHICVSKLATIGLRPGRRQTIICTNAGLSLNGPLGTNFSEISIEMHASSFKKMYLKTSPAKWRLFRLNVSIPLGNTTSTFALLLIQIVLITGVNVSEVLFEGVDKGVCLTRVLEYNFGKIYRNLKWSNVNPCGHGLHS